LKRLADVFGGEADDELAGFARLDLLAEPRLRVPPRELGLVVDTDEGRPEPGQGAREQPKPSDDALAERVAGLVPQPGGALGRGVELEDGLPG